MKSKRAFTLVELIVAAMIIGIGFLAVARTLPSSKRGAVVDRNRLNALRIARGTLDQVRCGPFLDSRYVGPTSTLVGPVKLQGESVEANQVYNQFAVISVTSQPAAAPPPVAGGTPLSFANVTVVVEWSEGTGKGSTTSATHGNNTLSYTGGVTREP